MKCNLLLSIVYQLINIISPLITLPYISRIFGSEGIGKYSYSISISSFFLIFIMLGIVNYGSREIAIRNNIYLRSKIFISIWAIQLITGVLVTLLFAFYCILVRDSLLRSMLLIQIITLISGILDITWFYYGVEKIKIIFLRNLILKLSSIILIFTLIKSPEDINKYAIIIASCQLVSNIFYLPLLKNEIILFLPKVVDIKKHLQGVIFLFYPIVAISIYRLINKIILGNFAGMEQLGLYDSADRIIMIPITIISAIGMVILPKMSTLFHKCDDYNILKVSSLTNELIAFISVGMMIGIITIADVFVPLFFGENFYDSINVTYILSFSILFISWSNFLKTQYLIPNKKDSIYVRSIWIGAGISVFSNCVLIHYFGAIGAAIATLITEFAISLYQTVNYGIRFFKQFFIPYFRYSILSLVIILLDNIIRHFEFPEYLHLLLTILTSAFSYFFVTIIYFYLFNKDIFDKIRKL